MSTVTLECNFDHFHDNFNEYSVSTVKTTLKESLCFNYFVMSLSSVLTDYCYHYLVVIIINNQTTFSGIE